MLKVLILHGVGVLSFRQGKPSPLFSDGPHIYHRDGFKDLEQVNNPGIIDPEIRFILRTETS